MVLVLNQQVILIKCRQATYPLYLWIALGRLLKYFKACYKVLVTYWSVSLRILGAWRLWFLESTLEMLNHMFNLTRVPVLSKALNFMIRDILARSTVTLSKSHWCASILFMRKKNQSLWLCVKFSSVIEVKNRWYFRCVGLFKLVLSILFCIYLFLSWCISSIHHTTGSIWVTYSAICVLLSNAHCIQYQTGWSYTFVSVILILQCM